MESAILSPQNNKLGRIWNISLPPVTSCKRNVPCAHEGCYALKAWQQYPDVRNAWTHNLNLFKRDHMTYFISIREFLSRRRKLDYFRWHPSGDIVNQQYIEGMKYIAERFPYCKFLAFTKRGDLFYGRLPNNLIIRYSYWPNYTDEVNKNISNFAYLTDDTRLPALSHLCPADCRNCKRCWDRNVKNVSFRKH